MTQEEKKPEEQDEQTPATGAEAEAETDAEDQAEETEAEAEGEEAEEELGPHSRFVEREPRRFNISALLWDQAPVLDAFAPANVRLIHDAEDLYVRYAEEAALGEDEQLLIQVRPKDLDATWRISVTGAGDIKITRPPGYPVSPHCRARFEEDARGPRVLVSIPVTEFCKPGELAHTPLDGDAWGFSVERVKIGAPAQRDLVDIPFYGGPTEQRIWMPDKYEDPYFGVSVLRFKTKTSKRKGVGVSMWPSPAEYLRTKDPAHAKFRIAKAGTYRIHVRLPKEEDEITDEEQIIPGESSCAAGTVFILPQIWRDMEAMEEDIRTFRKAAEEQGKEMPEEVDDNIEYFEYMVTSVDGYRVPGCREKMDPNFFELLKNQYADVREGLEAFMPDVAAKNPRPVEAEGLDMEAVIAAAQEEEEAEKAERGTGEDEGE